MTPSNEPTIESPAATDRAAYFVNVEGVVQRESKILFIVRGPGESHAAGALAFPGGKVEKTPAALDILEDTLRREIREETGVEVHPRMIYLNSSAFTSDDGRPFVDVVFLCAWQSGEPRISDPDEVADIRWLTAEEVLADPATPPWTRKSLTLAEEKKALLPAPPPDPEFTGKNAVVSLREVTKDNLRQVFRLKVSPRQESFVASNAVSLAQAYFDRDNAWFRAIYADETPVGFLMLWDNPDKGEYYLWRFLLAEPYQGFGYGKRALDLLVAHVRTRPGAKELLLSCVPADDGPCPFYEKYGFSYTGAEDDGELVMRLVL